MVLHFVLMDSSWWKFLLFYKCNMQCSNKVWNDHMSEMEVGPNHCGKMLVVSKSRFFFFLKVREQRRKRIEL